MLCSVSSLKKPALLVHFGSVLCFTLVQQGDQTSSLEWGAWLCQGSPLSLPSRFCCCLEPLQLCLQVTKHHLLPLPLLLCSYMTKKMTGFKRFFITWECFQRTQNICSHVGKAIKCMSPSSPSQFIWVPKFFRVTLPWVTKGPDNFPNVVTFICPTLLFW